MYLGSSIRYGNTSPCRSHTLASLCYGRKQVLISTHDHIRTSSIANIVSNRYRVTAVRTLSDVASLTTGTGRVDLPHIADRLPLPRESQSHTRILILLRACATGATGSGTVRLKRCPIPQSCAIVINIPWHSEGLQSMTAFKMKCSTPEYPPYKAL
jgi:hypothetical protein